MVSSLRVVFHQSVPVTGAPGALAATVAVAPAAAIAALQNAVVAIEVSLSAVAGVGAVGLPVSAGEANGAFSAKSAVRLVTSAWVMGSVGGKVDGLPVKLAHAR